MTNSMRSISYPLWALIFSLLALEAFCQETLTLWVDVDGAMPNKGQAICALFTSENSFLRRPYRSKTVEIDHQGKASFEFTGLESGTYAVSVIYDEDRNGELNKDFLGIPTEPFGVSNNARNRFGPPTFSKAKFKLKSAEKITIHLSNVKD